jgi:hypothetical protein
MVRGAIMILLIHYCAFLFSQNPTYTRAFDVQRKSIPIQIINNHPDYFYVLRYNKLAHDLTLERRIKPSGEIRAFTPLKLDSVNADGFDYEKLTYRFFEKNNEAYFVFEKVRNTKKEVWLKIIDTTGRTSGFIELGSLEKDKTVSDFKFEFKVTAQGKLLVIGSQTFINSTSKKLVLLYDPETREKIWVKKLPLENPYTGFSQCFTTNANNDLFYILTKAQLSGTHRKFINHTQVYLPVFFYDSLEVIGLLNNDAAGIHRAVLAIHGLTALKSISIHTAEKQLTIVAHYTQENGLGEDNPFFFAQSFSNDLEHAVFSVITPLNATLKDMLTFYDGTDYDSAADKDYSLLETISSDGCLYYVAGRSEINYYKELLLWKVNLRNGVVLDQEIIPRKIFYFDDRTRFKNIGVTAQQACQGSFYTFVLEDPGNFQKDPREFNFQKFLRQKYLWQANLVAYILRPGGGFEKKLVHKNGRYDFIPLNYISNQCDFVFYLHNGDREQFAFLRLDGY